MANRDTTYRDKNLFEYMVILYVYCGTWIFSMFSAKTEAVEVKGIDVSYFAEKPKILLKKLIEVR